MVRDYTKSPYTGMTRECWRQAGLSLLSGIFAEVKSIEEPIILPRQETEITYPHKSADAEQLVREQKAEAFESLARSFLVASVLIADDPAVTVNGIPLADYYRRQILRAVTPGDKLYVYNWHDMQKLTGSADSNAFYQQTVECGALVIGLDNCRSVLFDCLEKNEKDAVAAFLSDYGHAPTVPNNWRLFNMLILAFLKKSGYETDERIMADHARAILDCYAGDGWYRDGRVFDYYNFWAFHFYLPLWNEWYGKEHMPDIAQRFKKNTSEFLKTCCRFFGRDGHVNMWGRSCIYRNAATAAICAAFVAGDADMDPGWTRRICSGALLQFTERDDLLADRVPSLGFYGQFMPLVQSYSCAASPLWLGEAFICLRLPESHPFWSTVENEGYWAEIKNDEVRETLLPGPGLMISNHEANGETVLRSAKVLLAPEDIHGMWNYSKLSYNSDFPWEAAPATEDRKDTSVESMQYLAFDPGQRKTLRANATFYSGCEDGVFYRRQHFDYSLETEPHWIPSLDLADFPVRYGILRFDRLRLPGRPLSFTLGSYGFPENGTKMTRLVEKDARAIVLTGRNHRGETIQMAMTVWSGWNELFTLDSHGTNPDSPDSVIIAAKIDINGGYNAAQPRLLISQVITKKGDEPFAAEDIFPIHKIVYSDKFASGVFGDVTIILKNAKTLCIRWGSEGSLIL